LKDEGHIEAKAALFTMEMILGILVVAFLVLLVVVFKMWSDCKSKNAAGGKKKKRKVLEKPAEFETLDDVDDDEPVVTTL